MWLKSALLICCAVSTLGDERIVAKLRPAQTYSNIQSENIEAVTFRDRSIPIEEYVTSRKAHIAKYDDDYYGGGEDEEIKVVKTQNKKVPERLENLEKKQTSFKENDRVIPKKQTRVELENFSGTGVLHEDGIKKVDSHRAQVTRQRDSVIPGVYVSNEYQTTMLPTLTTPREARSFDFIPVNIIREDSKDAYTSYADRQFGDLSDVSLVPAGTSSRIQVKKGPNGKDYEYEYVYYYYDEDDEGKASSATNTQDTSSRTTPSSSRRGATNVNRSKYTNVERSTTAEPVSNEVIPNRNRGRQLAEADEISEERLPTNTRFPPRSRSNHNTGTTESSRVRGNRPRPSLELVDSSSFRTHQEGPEFPQNLPKGPVRFIGVTPNEDNEEKPSKNRARPHRVQEPAPVEESNDDVQPIFRRRPASSVDHEAQAELNRGQPSRQASSEDVESETPGIVYHNSGEKKTHLTEKQDTESSDLTTTDIPTTEYPSAMDKVALDLYAFFQQGQSNLVESSSESDSTNDSTTLSEGDFTELITTTEPATPAVTTESTTTSTEPSTTTTTTPEPTTSATTTTGRGKFRRPGVPGGPISRNRFKLNGGGSTTESSNSAAEPTQKVRGRFGSNGNSGFKRPRPGQKHPVDEEVQKENAAPTNAEKPNGTRNRFRGTGNRNISGTTPGSVTPASSSGPVANSPALRPTFNKLNINRRRGRPSTASPSASEETSEGAEPETHEAVTPKPSARPKLPGVAPRPARPGARVNLRPRPGQATSTTAAPEAAEASVDEPASEGTEEETHAAPAESSPPNRLTTVNPLNKLRNRNRLQVQPKTTTRSPISTTPRRSPLLPRRKTTETPVEEPVHEQESEEESFAETEPTEVSIAETSTAASTKHEEVRGLSGLLAPRRRIAPRRPGQIISRE
ncbi:proteoglycan 4-like [Leptopilina heterotoma]|uniref:proteoglycan 4-like n=1 Tax=Leptopilina heterotoma TaxID=63436 RepID=UPI001CA99630|nr:proteoglycan 4-like [Leptopilina heterotoma]